MEHLGYIPTDESDSTSGENRIILIVVGLTPFRAGGVEASQKPHYPTEEFPHCGELEKHLLDAAAAPVLLSVDLENLNCFSITEGEKGGERRRGEWRERRDGAAVGTWARCCSSSWQPAQHVHSPDWKTKGLQPRSTGKSVGTAQMWMDTSAWA